MEDFSKYNGEGTTLRKAQLRMLEILIEVDKICRKYNIQYWLDFGTLLGAVRHKGFIPWDDDADICIKSEDFHRFIEICKAELNPQFFLQTKSAAPNTPYGGKGICCIRDNNSLLIQDYENFRIPYSKGVFVDIFESISYPDMPPALFRFLSRRIKFSYLFFRFFPLLNFKNIVCYFVYPVSYVFWSFIFKIIFLQKDRSKRYSRPEMYPYGLFSKETDFFPLKEVEFEGHLFFAPANPHARLKDTYGDYMQIPPEGKRRTHAKYIFVE
jgi:lipopolysaccharide cholinephosphotransferase